MGAFRSQLNNFFATHLRRLAEEVGVLSIDKTADGVALKFSEKARISPEKLGAFVRDRDGRTFTPTGVLRLNLSADEEDQVLDRVRDALLQLRLDG